MSKTEPEKQGIVDLLDATTWPDVGKQTRVDLDFGRLNDYFEQMFASELAEQRKHIIIGAVYPSRRIAGGDIMWRRKKRFAKKRRKWLDIMFAMSAERFLSNGGLKGTAQQGEGKE